MKVFLVGGAVRDMLMGIKPKDFDFVVVGSSPEEMLSYGFQQVGADFPVFLHPHTGDEFALARTERSTGKGHTGFDCKWEGVTLEEDLSRRDLTINAMAVECTGFNESEGWIGDIRHDLDKWPLQAEDDPFGQTVIDPFNGVQHIKDKILEHIGPHFTEDPLRVLRLCRLQARFGDEWRIDSDTISLCDRLVREGHLDSLTPERVWKEMSRALMEPSPDLFFSTLHFLDWTGMPELVDLFKCPQRPDFHPEGDAGIHTLLCLRAAAKMELSLPERFAVLCHDFGKWPAHLENTSHGKHHLGGHEWMGVPLIHEFCDRWKVDNDCRKLATTVARDHTNVHNLNKLNPKTTAKMLERWDVLRHPDRWLQIINCCTADGRGRGPKFENMDHPNDKLLARIVGAWQAKVDVEELQQQQRDKGRPLLTGDKIGEKVRRIRLGRLEEEKKTREEVDNWLRT